MEDHQDTYDHEVYDYVKGHDSFEIVERIDGHIDVPGGPPVYFSEYKDWPPQNKQGWDTSGDAYLTLVVPRERLRYAFKKMT